MRNSQFHVLLSCRRIAGSISHARLRVCRYYLEHRVASDIVTQRIGYAHGQLILLAQSCGILRAKVELIVSHLRSISLGKRVGIRICVAIHHGSCISAPKVAYVGTNRESLYRLPSCTKINQMQTARATICVERRQTTCSIKILTNRIVVAHISIWQYTEAHAQMLESSKSGNSIFKVGIIGINLSSTLFEVCLLSRHTHIKDKGKAIEL